MQGTKKDMQVTKWKAKAKWDNETANKPFNIKELPARRSKN